MAVLQTNETLAKRVERALEELDIAFHKTRPTRLFLRKAALEPETVLTEQSLKHFERLFDVVNSRLQAHVRRSEKPFSG